MNGKDLRHSQEQPQAPNAIKKANNQTDYQRLNTLDPPKVPSLQALGLGQSQVQDTHSAINNLKRNSLRLVNLTENYAQLTFKAPC